MKRRKKLRVRNIDRFRVKFAASPRHQLEIRIPSYYSLSLKKWCLEKSTVKLISVLQNCTANFEKQFLLSRMLSMRSWIRRRSPISAVVPCAAWPVARRRCQRDTVNGTKNADSSSIDASLDCSSSSSAVFATRRSVPPTSCARSTRIGTSTSAVRTLSHRKGSSPTSRKCRATTPVTTPAVRRLSSIRRRHSRKLHVAP